MYVGRPVRAASRPSYSLLAREYTTLRALWHGAHARAGVRGRGRAVRARADATSPADARSSPARRRHSLRATPFARAGGDAPATAPSTTRTRGSGRTRSRRCSTRRDRPASPKGVINTQRMLCANQEMLRTVLPLLGRGAAGPLRLAAVEPHVRRQPQLRARALQRRHALHRRREADAGGVRHAPSRNLREIATTAYFNVPRGYELLVPRLRGRRRGSRRTSSAA